MSSARRKGSSGSSSQLQVTPGLRECVQHRLMKDVFEQSSVTHPGWKILIVDEVSMKVISAAVGMYDIMERKITLVESLEKKRAPFPDMGAIYILEPSEKSINRLLEDFSSKSKLLYGSNIFVYFLDRIPEPALERIKRCRLLIKRLKALSEINIHFLAREERAFVLDMKDSFKAFYVRKAATPMELAVAEKLVTVCATLNEFPYIRYKQSSGICNSLASLFKLKMDQFVAANPTWWYHGSGKSGKKHMERDRSTFLLLDRSYDCLTPLMHDFTYQAMVRDLLPMEGDKITYKAGSGEEGKEDKDVLLNENDKLWVELRGKHIAQVIEVLSARIQDVVNSSTGNAFSKKTNADGSSMSLSQMASALKELPEYREVMSKLSQHMHLSHECMDKFNKEGLLDLGDIEQTLATGKDDEGRSAKLSEVINRVEGALIRLTDPVARLRLVLIATISQNGLSSGDRDRVLRSAQLDSTDLKILESLEHLGISTVSSSSPSSGGFFGGKSKMSTSGTLDEDSEFTSSRYVPKFKTILQEMVTNQLSVDEYPSVVPMPESTASTSTSAHSARRRGNDKKGATSKWERSGSAESGSKAITNFTGGRNLVFMVGGISYSELRVAREIMEREKREVVVGSTAFVSPTEFLKDISTLD